MTDATKPAQTITTPDGRTVDDVIDQQYSEMIDDLGQACAQLLELGQSMMNQATKADDDDRVGVVLDLETVAGVLSLVCTVRDNLRTRETRAAFTREMFERMAEQTTQAPA